MQCVYPPNRGSTSTTYSDCLHAGLLWASISQRIGNRLYHVWNLFLVCGVLFSLQHYLSFNKTSLAWCRTVLALNEFTRDYHHDSRHIYSRHLLCLHLWTRLAKIALGHCQSFTASPQPVQVLWYANMNSRSWSWNPPPLLWSVYPGSGHYAGRWWGWIFILCLACQHSFLYCMESSDMGSSTYYNTWKWNNIC